MKINGVDFEEMAKPAKLEITEDNLSTIFRMEYGGKAYRYALSNFELIIKCITNVINEGKRQLGIIKYVTSIQDPH